jgi:hypothetical protein
MMFAGNKDLVREYHRRKAGAQVEGLHRLYLENDVDFRGVR